MPQVQHATPPPESTPVDEVRRICERLSIEHGNDVEKLADYAEQLTRASAEKLGLRPSASGKQ